MLSPFTRLLLMGGSILSVLWFSTMERSTTPPRRIDFSTLDRSKSCELQHLGQVWPGHCSFCCSLALTSPTVTPTQTDTADLLWTRKPQSPLITPQIHPEYL